MTEELTPRAGRDLPDYDAILADVAGLVEEARRSVVRTVNASMTALYWLIGCRIVESEQSGKERAEYGEGLVERLSADLSTRYGRGFSVRNVWQMKAFYLAWPHPGEAPAEPGGPEILQTPSAQSGENGILQTLSAESPIAEIARRFSLPWAAYVRLLSVKSASARHFYETEALRGGWSVRQLNRQVNSQFYERTALSRNKAAMLEKGQIALPEDTISPQEAIKDPFVLEFLDLKDEYSESDLEEALIHHLETFLLELGGDFCFVGRQKRLRVGDAWYRIDLIFFHRRLRSLVVIELKLGAFTHADAGQMHLYLNYAREHWTHEGENPPVGLILCAQKDAAVAHYALEGLPNQVMASEYRTALPDADELAAEIERTRAVLEERAASLPEGELE